MASAAKILVLDLGMQSLRLAEFSILAKKELKLLRAAKKELLFDPSLEATRPFQIREALQEILKEWGIRTARLVLVLPAHTVFTRVTPVEVPIGNSAQMEAVINFEAQDHIPFPLEEVVWDYVVLGETPAGAVNVAFIAVKSDLLEELCKSITSTGLQIVSITSAPIALYDAFLNTYPEEAATSTTLLLDIGSRTTNFIICSPGSFFSRSIPSGGLAVTTAISKDMNLPLEEAETLKVSRAIVGLGAGFAPPEDPVEANLASLTRHALLKTQASISQSLSHYRTSLGGSDPSLILLTGGMASMPYLAEFLSEKLLKPVAFFDPLRGITTDETLHSTVAVFLESDPNNLGELLGGALFATTAPHTEVNLLPPSLTKKKELAKRLPWLAAAAALFIASLVSWYAFALYATSLTREETAKIIGAINAENTVAEKIKKHLADLNVIDRTSEQFLSLIQLREAYPTILNELGSKVPERFLWITEVLPVADKLRAGSPGSGQYSIKAISVRGLYLDNPRQASVIDDFVTALQSSDLFTVEEKDKSKIIVQRASPNGEFWAYPFSLLIPLRTPITQLP